MKNDVILLNFSFEVRHSYIIFFYWEWWDSYLHAYDVREGEMLCCCPESRWLKVFSHMNSGHPEKLCCCAALSCPSVPCYVVNFFSVWENGHGTRAWGVWVSWTGQCERVGNLEPWKWVSQSHHTKSDEQAPQKVILWPTLVSVVLNTHRLFMSRQNGIQAGQTTGNERLLSPHIYWIKHLVGRLCSWQCVDALFVKMKISDGKWWNASSRLGASCCPKRRSCW